MKELIINAIKANYKNIYFEGYASRNRLHETLTYETSLRLFQLEMSSENAQHLERIAKKEDIKAEIELFENGNILHVIVTNPGRMTQTELKNINHKLIDAENCRDIAEYFLRNMDDPTREGAGLGLILIKMMLKSLHAPADSLTITCEENRTTAYLKVPLVTDVEICA
ncbi:MAG: hypothetical protein A2176_00695 [Spirochaetes bacterium RBG_13_51_14]|nr:MAG: hypothetical protein A2176_00695 [Spirochaetes bacterium RBG_13_51_14]